MIKLITRFVLSLCILLSSGYSQLYAHAIQEGVQYAPANSLLSHQSSTVDTDFSNHIHILHTHTSGTVKVDVTDIEEKDDILVSFKKFVQSSNYYTAIFCTLILGFLFRFIQKSLFFSKNFYYKLSHRKHLLIQVFTI
ncbi:hypothetical protein AAGF08_18595 [Algoriphagus sp. SE2]|uniref:hypothetical protein n=1 Tax=Algoriphagus sp. SE2 TaxID=3141536 RepID=UPI0031CD158D